MVQVHRGDGAGSTRDLSFVVAVATYQRPEGIRRILPLLAEQARALPWSARVVVVDNSPKGSAKADVEPWVSNDVTYLHEPHPGISAARNCALAFSIDCRADAVVFIDDDEIPGSGWLNAMASAWATWRCDAVAGPVISRLAVNGDAWVDASGVFTRRSVRSGETVRGAASNNLLLSVRSLVDRGLTFDQRYGLSGGSDTMLIHTLVESGGTVRWCDEAEVVDIVPRERCNRRWILRRTVRTSNTWSRVALDLPSAKNAVWRVRLDLTARAGYRALRGGMLTLSGLGAHRDVRRRALGMCDLASSAGMILGAWGRVRHEYQRAEEAA